MYVHLYDIQIVEEVFMIKLVKYKFFAKGYEFNNIEINIVAPQIE